MINFIQIFHVIYTLHSVIFSFLFRELTDISILNKFIHLRFVDISRNNIKDISPLSTMSHLLTLTANQNFISAVNLEVLPYLQNASFQRNKIQTTEGLNHPMLESLCLNCELMDFFSNL